MRMPRMPILASRTSGGGGGFSVGGGRSRPRYLSRVDGMPLSSSHGLPLISIAAGARARSSSGGSGGARSSGGSARAERLAGARSFEELESRIESLIRLERQVSGDMLVRASDAAPSHARTLSDLGASLGGRRSLAVAGRSGAMGRRDSRGVGVAGASLAERAGLEGRGDGAAASGVGVARGERERERERGGSGSSGAGGRGISSWSLGSVGRALSVRASNARSRPVCFASSAFMCVCVCARAHVHALLCVCQSVSVRFSVASLAPVSTVVLEHQFARIRRLFLTPVDAVYVCVCYVCACVCRAGHTWHEVCGIRVFATTTLPHLSDGKLRIM